MPSWITSSWKYSASSGNSRKQQHFGPNIRPVFTTVSLVVRRSYLASIHERYTTAFRSDHQVSQSPRMRNKSISSPARPFGNVGYNNRIRRQVQQQRYQSSRAFAVIHHEVHRDHLRFSIISLARRAITKLNRELCARASQRHVANARLKTVIFAEKYQVLPGRKTTSNALRRRQLTASAQKAAWLPPP